MTLKDLVVWVADVPDSLPEEMRPMAGGQSANPFRQLQKD